MDGNQVLKVAGGLLALLMIVPLVVSAVRQNGAGQSFAMWALWAVLDTTVTVSLIAQEGNLWLSAGYAAGSVTLAGVLLVKGRCTWGRMESLIAVLVVACLVTWKLGGPRVATVSATVAIVIAGVPGMLELWRSPQRSQAMVWAGFTLANLLSLAGGAGWSIEERLAPAMFAGQTLVLTLIGLRPVPKPSGVT